MTSRLPGGVETVVAAVCGTLALLALAVAPRIADASVVLPSPGSAVWWVVAAGVVLQALALLTIDAHPRAGLVAVAIPIPLVALAGAGDATSTTALAVIAATWLAVRSLPLMALAGPLAVVAVAMAAGGTISAADIGTDRLGAVGGSLVQAAGTLVPAILIAAWSRAVRETTQAREAQGRAVVREQDALIQAAIARERTDMARELHDIAAHHLSGIAVLAAAVERQIDTDPAGAKHAVRQVREQSTVVLRDLRSLVGLLRDHDHRDDDPDPRPETITGISDLVSDAAATGRDISLTILGTDPDPDNHVGPLAQLAAYRAVQEALTNATRHAPGAPCRVTIDNRDDHTLTVTVDNDPPHRPTPVTSDGRSGFGLIGMQERAQLTNATLQAGPTPDGGWQIALQLPREATP